MSRLKMDYGSPYVTSAGEVIIIHRLSEFGVEGADYFICRSCGKTYWFYSQYCCDEPVQPLIVIKHGKALPLHVDKIS